ncbi:MAG: ribosomal protein S4E [Colwellia sp.]|jgi:ribosomal protein S4E
MSPFQIIYNVRQQLKLNEIEQNTARLKAHKVELIAKSNQIIQKNHLIVNTIAAH